MDGIACLVEGEHDRGGDRAPAVLDLTDDLGGDRGSEAATSSFAAW